MTHAVMQLKPIARTTKRATANALTRKESRLASKFPRDGYDRIHANFHCELRTVYDRDRLTKAYTVTH